MNHDWIRSNLYGLLLINKYHELASRISERRFSDIQVINKWYKAHLGRLPDIENPKRFSEKQQWYKLYDRKPLMAQCADKYDVREYIESCNYGYLLNDIYGIYDDVKSIPIDKLPKQFVLKATHGSGFNLIVRDKDEINWRMWKKIMKSWLRQDIYWSGREWVYKDLKHRIVAEKYLEDETGELRDYKFFCFNGTPRFMQLEIGRYAEKQTRNFYDMDWNLMPFGKELPRNPDVHIERPYAFDEMKKIAADLCKPFTFVRVDLYQVNGRVYFGELTFFPAGGAPDFVPDKYDEIVGDMWDLKPEEQNV